MKKGELLIILSTSYNTLHGFCLVEDPTLNPDDFTNASLDKKNADWDKLYERFDAAVDWPTANFYKELLQKYPDAKVILTIRSIDSWYKSIEDTIFRGIERTYPGQPGEPHYAVKNMWLNVAFDGAISDPAKFKEIEMVKKLFNDHNEEVKRIVPPEQLYIMPLGSGWDGLCKFLGKDVPNEPYPQKNAVEQYRSNPCWHVNKDNSDKDS